MKARSWFSLAAWLVVLGVAAGAQAALVNPGFESGATGWTTYNYTAGAAGEFVSGGHLGMAPAEGSGYWADVRSYDTNGTGEHKGVYQTVGTVAGQPYTLTAAVQAFSNDTDFAYIGGSQSITGGPNFNNEVKIGYDLAGGTDPKGGSVSYSAPQDTGAQWADVSVNFTATGPTTTVFLDANPKWALAGNWSGFDNVRLTGPSGPTPALVAYYPLNGDTLDHSGNAHHGTAQGDAAFDGDSPAQLGGGQSMRFSGGGHVDLGNPAELDFGFGDWTVSGWIKTTQGDKGTLFSNGGDGGGGIRYVLTQNEGSNGPLRLVVDDDSDKVQPETTSDTNDDQWHHIVGIRQGRAVAVYVDGELQRSDDLPAGYDLSGTSQQPAHIGAARQQSDSSLIKQLTGLADDVAVWSVTLPHAAIQGLADGSYSPLTAPLTAPLPDFLPPGATVTDFLNIDIGDSGQRVEPGWAGLSSTAASLTAATGDAVNVTLDNMGTGGLDWRDRGDSTNTAAPLVLVGEDHIKNNLGIIRATLEGVPEGDYLVTAFFVDAENSQSEAIDILLTDATGTNVLQAVQGDASFPGGNPGGSGEHFLTTNLMDAHSASFLMVSDGLNPLEIVFNGSQAADTEVPLSGLMIQAVQPIIPEPATMAMLGLAVAGLGGYVRRRRRA